jgi:hypothetical protein
MAIRKYIYIGERLATAAAPLTKLLDGDTSAINAIGDRYLEMVRRHRPELTLDEWCAVADALNGAWSEHLGNHEAATVITLGMAQTIHDSDVGEKWDVDAASLVRAVDALDYAGRLAVLHVVEAVWADDRQNVRLVLQEILGDKY